MAITILSAAKKRVTTNGNNNSFCRKGMEPLFLTISTIIELIVCGYFLLNSKKMKFRQRSYSVRFNLCLHWNA